MAHQYEADKMLQLLRFASWKANTEIVQSGLIDLAAKVSAFHNDDPASRTERYFVDLYSSINIALKQDGIVAKNEASIQRLLAYCGFASWDDWKERLSNTRNYARPDKFDLIDLDKVKVAIWYHESLRPLFSKMKLAKNYAYPLEEITRPEEAPMTNAPHVLQRLKESAFVVWVVPVTWKHQLKVLADPSWQELMDTGRIVPVWMDPDDCWGTTPPLVSEQPAKVIWNASGVLTSLLYLEEKINSFLNPASADPSEDPIGEPKTTGPHFYDSSSGFFQRDGGTQHISVQNISGGTLNYTSDK